MRIFRGTSGIKGIVKRPVVTIGNFDGIHKGHLDIFNRVINRAKEIDGEAVVFTFCPHPVKIISPELSPPLLTSFKRKVALISEAGINYLICARFTKRFASQDPRTFASEVLVKDIGTKEVFVGYDYKFGKGREGTTHYLEKMGDELGFRVTVVEAVESDGKRVSSTLIRKLLGKGEVEEAALKLGRYYSIEGNIIEGRKIGGGIGFPTANIAPPAEHIPSVGVYAVLIEINGKEHKGVTNVGFNPTFHRDRLSVETHILDFNEDVYGSKITIKFLHRLRDELEFKQPSDLITQIKKDIEKARSILS
jgi:riboflavin kinase/FMN adenylyltransferase